MGKLYRFLLALILFFSCGNIYAQYFVSPNDPIYLRWRKLDNREKGDIIYPNYLGRSAYNVSLLRDTLTPFIGYNLDVDIRRFPIILHPTNLLSNGLVTYTPSRMELYTTPNRDNFSLPWIKHLVAHEYRHVAQMSKLNQGITKFLSHFLGEQMLGLTAMTVPSYFYEGDAVTAETQLSIYGRGKQPNFNAPLRALILEGKKLSPAVYRLGAMNTFTPDAYLLGYHVTQYATEVYGDDFWEKCLTYAARNPYLIDPLFFAYNKYGRTNSSNMIRNVSQRLRDFWLKEGLQDNSTEIIGTAAKCYTTYRSPLAIDNSTVYVVKGSYSRANGIYSVDMESSEEHFVTPIGTLSSYLFYHNNKIYWGEITPSLSWGQKNFSSLYSYDLNTKRKRREVNTTSFFFTPYKDDMLVAIHYNDVNMPSIVTYDTNTFNESEVFLFEDKNISVNGLCYNPENDKVYCAIVDNNGTSIVEVDLQDKSIKHLISPSYNTITNLSCASGKLLYTSINSGVEEICAYNLSEGREYQLTTSRYGSTGSSLSPNGDRLVTTTYTPQGYLLSGQQVEYNNPTEWHDVPSNRYNYPYKEWDNIIKLDTISFSDSEIAGEERKKPSKRYSKFANALNFHSYAPFFVDIDELVSTQTLRGGVGVTLMSQNLLNNLISTLGYGYIDGYSLYKGEVSYTGLPLHFSFDVEYDGGYQDIYGNISSVDLANIEKKLSFATDVELPFNLSGGGRSRYFSASAGYRYVNDLTYVTPNDVIDGEHRLEYSVYYQNLSLMSKMDLNPRWGYVSQFMAIAAPFSSVYKHSSLYALYLRGYTPGPFANGSISVQAAAMRQSNGELYFGETVLMPRGTSYYAAIDKSYSTTVDYRVPLFYPNWGFGTRLNFQRVAMSLFCDYARYATIYQPDMWLNSHAIGGSIMFSINVLGFSQIIDIDCSVYKPSDAETVNFG